MDEDGELLRAGIMDHPPKLLLVWKPLQTYEYEERLKLGNQWTLAFTWVCEVDLIHAFTHSCMHSVTHSLTSLIYSVEVAVMNSTKHLRQWKTFL